ncbi:unnamed protein product [Closterium sp. NIES-53]
MTNLRVLLDVAAQREYELHSLDFSIAFLQGSLHEEVWLCRPSAFTGNFPPGTQWRLRRPVYDLHEAPREWHDTPRTITLSQSHMVQQVLQRFELQHSTVQHRPLAVDYRLTGTFPDKPFEPSGPYAELVGCLISLDSCCEGGEVPSDDIRLLGGRQAVVLTGHYDSSYADDVEAHMSTQGYCFSLGSGAVSWRSTRSSSVSTSTAEAEIYDGAMAAQELRWLTFLLTDLGERPSSAPTLFIDNKATILLCREP